MTRVFIRIKPCMVLAGVVLMYSFAVSQPVALGQSCALSGPAKELGLDMKAGVEAYLKDISGINLISRDDKYEPEICRKNTEELLSQGIPVLFAYVGTPTAKVAVPMAMERKTIFFGAFTGASFLSDQKSNPYSFSVRASYDMETDYMVEHLFADLGIREIGIFIQDDAFGDAGKTGVEKAIGKRAGKGITIVAEGRFPRNTLAVREGADKVMNSGAKAVILVGPYLPCATTIKYWKSKGYNVPFINISFVGSNALAALVKDDPKNIAVTQVVPFPWDSKIPLIAEYQKKVGQNIGFGTLEGYICAKTIHKAIVDAGDTVNSETIKAALEKMNYDLGGVWVRFGPQDHQGMDLVEFTRINPDGGFSKIKSLKDL